MRIYIKININNNDITTVDCDNSNDCDDNNGTSQPPSDSNNDMIQPPQLDQRQLYLFNHFPPYLSFGL